MAMLWMMTRLSDGKDGARVAPSRKEGSPVDSSRLWTRTMAQHEQRTRTQMCSFQVQERTNPYCCAVDEKEKKGSWMLRVANTHTHMERCGRYHGRLSVVPEESQSRMRGEDLASSDWRHACMVGAWTSHGIAWSAWAWVGMESHGMIGMNIDKGFRHDTPLAFTFTHTFSLSCSKGASPWVVSHCCKHGVTIDHGVTVLRVLGSTFLPAKVKKRTKFPVAGIESVVRLAQNHAQQYTFNGQPKKTTTTCMHHVTCPCPCLCPRLMGMAWA